MQAILVAFVKLPAGGTEVKADTVELPEVCARNIAKAWRFPDEDGGEWFIVPGFPGEDASGDATQP